MFIKYFLLFSFSQMGPINWFLVLLMNLIPFFVLCAIVHYLNYFMDKKFMKVSEKSSLMKKSFFNG